jgi:hypothetical protein
MDYTKLKSFCIARWIINREKRQAGKCELSIWWDVHSHNIQGIPKCQQQINQITQLKI